MPIVLLAGAAMIGLFLLLALFGGKGGPTETAPNSSGPRAEGPWIWRLSPDAFEKLLQRLFTAMGLEVERSEVRREIVDLVVRDPAPISGGRIFVRGILHADAGMVQQAEVQAALDLARGEATVKALVLSPMGFSAEARLAVARTVCELVDGEGLIELLRQRLPEVLESAGAGYV